MATIVSEVATTLNTTNGFYRVESKDLGTVNNAGAYLSTFPSQAITFANAGNCRGVVLGARYLAPNVTNGINVHLQQIMGTATLSIASPCIVTLNGHGFSGGEMVMFSTTGALPTGITANTIYYVKLIDLNTFNLSLTSGGADINTSGSQSGTHTLYAVRATSTRTNAQIIGHSDTTRTTGIFVVPFLFASPYAVDTNVGKWRIWCSCTGTVTANELIQSGTSGLFHAIWCDTAVSHTDDDQLVVAAPTVIDKTASVGNTVANDPAIFICANTTDLTAENVCLLRWENPASASYTLSVKGNIVLSSHSGLRVGTATNPITSSAQAIIDFKDNLVGTYSSTGSYVPLATIGGNHYYNSKHYLYLYGEVPAGRETTLSQNESSGQAHIHTTDDMSAIWQTGDIIYVFKNSSPGYADQYVYRTITNISGTDVTLSSNLGTNRIAGGKVINMTRYGVKLVKTTTANYSLYMQASFNELVISGVSVYGFQIGNVMTTSYNIVQYPDSPSYCGTHKILNSLFYWSSLITPISFNVGANGLTIDGCHNPALGLASLAPLSYSPTQMSGTITVTNNVAGNANISGLTFGVTVMPMYPVVSNNFFYNLGWGAPSMSYAIMVIGYGGTYTNNYIWGVNGTAGYNHTGTSINSTISGGTVANCKVAAIYYGSCSSQNCIYSGVTFSANTNTIDYSVNGIFDNEIYTPIGAVTVNETSLISTIPEQVVRISNNNSVTNADLHYSKYGEIARTGTGLADTTVRTAGGFGMRFRPLSSTSPLTWQQTIPTGNIQNKSMTVYVWCKINAAAYYSATYQLPRLTIDYDNGTTAYVQASASTDWQLLSVTFTPVTTYGQIKATVSTMTDQTSTNAYVYFDDYGVLYPPGHQLNLGSLDLWANALPLMPTIATNLSAQDVWTASASTDYGTGTLGNKVESLKNPSVLIDGEVIV